MQWVSNFGGCKSSYFTKEICHCRMRLILLKFKREIRFSGNFSMSRSSSREFPLSIYASTNGWCGRAGWVRCATWGMVWAGRRCVGRTVLKNNCPCHIISCFLPVLVFCTDMDPDKNNTEESKYPLGRTLQTNGNLWKKKNKEIPRPDTGSRGKRGKTAFINEK